MEDSNGKPKWRVETQSIASTSSLEKFPYSTKKLSSPLSSFESIPFRLPFGRLIIKVHPSTSKLNEHETPASVARPSETHGNSGWLDGRNFTPFRITCLRSTCRPQSQFEPVESCKSNETAFCLPHFACHPANLRMFFASLFLCCFIIFSYHSLVQLQDDFALPA